MVRCAAADAERNHSTRSRPSLNPEQSKLYQQEKLWVLLDSYTLQLAKWLACREKQDKRGSVNVSEVNEHAPYPNDLCHIMAPLSLYSYRSDLFSYGKRSGPDGVDSRLGLTQHGLHFAEGERPDVSPGHQQAISDLVKSSVMNDERADDLDRLLRYVPRVERQEFEDALKHFLSVFDGKVGGITQTLSMMRYHFVEWELDVFSRLRPTRCAQSCRKRFQKTENGNGKQSMLDMDCGVESKPMSLLVYMNL